ncbi:MAG: SIR2 family protein, partial [Kiritimatiellae bacterium]|nr:SIR2 family protein [Kiritimatiellia bacterium]
MILGQVDFPDELLSAQENGELLVFAGAGVSMGPPANLPSFTGLVKTIGHRSGLPWRKHLSFDHYLGQLEKRNVAVHALARQAVTIPGTSHTPLHTDLVRLFKGASRVRVVTTNYDDHFESATFEAYGENLKTYAAPALPYGDDFSGIVHVHGHTDTRDSRLVLTDRDFGRAYSTEGWARRFLVDAFLRYTVLFVGYSHQDPPMVYLARGMPVDRKRVFALTAEAEKTDWKHLDIESVPFPVLEPARPFGALDDGVRKWADLVNARPLEHKERVCRLLSQGPGRLTHEEDAYLQFIFRQKTYLPWFVQFGLTADWLHWTESRGLLSPTFDSLPTDLYERRHGELVTWWFARSAMAHCDAALNVYKRSSLKMPVHLWNAIGQAIHSSKDLDQRTRRIWLIQLCDRWTVDCDIQYLEYALAPLAEAGDFDSVAMILRLLLAPMVHYKDSIRWNLDDPETYPDIVLRSSDRLWTKELFEKHGEALFRSQSAEIAEMAGGFLSRAYSAFVSHYGEENAYDPISMRRSAIEPHEQDQYSDDVELLVEAARDGLCGLRNSNRPLYLAYLKEWQSDPASILKRIAYHAVNTDVNISPEEKLQYVVDNHGLSHSAEHHEVFLLIVQNFQLAGPESQKQILDYNRAETLQTVKNHPNSDPRYFWRSEYDLLNGILNEGGRTRAVSQRFSAIKRRYPEWEPKDHPDFLSYHSAAVSGMKTPFTADDLRKMRISKVLDYLENYKGGVRFHEPSREGLFFSFHTASSQDPKWGIRVGDKALGKKLASSGHILDCLYSGLQQAEDVPWNEVLSFTRAIPFRYLPSRNVLFLLQYRNWFAVSSVTEFSWIEKLCMRVVKRSARMRDQPSEPDNWYSVAINSDCGLAMRLAITFQHVRFQLKAGSPGHLTKPFKAMVELVMSAENVSGNLCRCILLSKIEVLFQLEKVWAEKVLFPLLDWKKGPDTAFPCWQGFLNNGK